MPTTTNLSETPEPGGERGVGGGGDIDMISVEDSLRQRGVQVSLSSLLGTASIEAVRRSIEWWDRQPNVQPGLLVEVIRRGGISEPSKPETFQAKQKAYGEEIADWLKAKMPYVCQTDRRIIEAVRELDGDAEAEALAASTSPHYAAVAAVIRLHGRHGKGRLTVGEHGAVIRAAVKAANEEAVEDYKAIKANRNEGSEAV